MTDDKERDAVMVQYKLDPTLPESNQRWYENGFRDGWNASRKHRDAEIADELSNIFRTLTDRTYLDTLDCYIKRLREGTK